MPAGPFRREKAGVVARRPSRLGVAATWTASSRSRSTMRRRGASGRTLRAAIVPRSARRPTRIGQGFLERFMATTLARNRFFINGSDDKYLFRLVGVRLSRLRDCGGRGGEWTRHCSYAGLRRASILTAAREPKEAIWPIDFGDSRSDGIWRQRPFRAWPPLLAARGRSRRALPQSGACKNTHVQIFVAASRERAIAPGNQLADGLGPNRRKVVSSCKPGSLGRARLIDGAGT